MRVVILGCGYVGLELGRQLLENDQDVIGVRRSDAGLEAIRTAGFTAVRADVTDAASLSHVPDADAVVFAASSGGRGAAAARDVYVDGLRTVVETLGSRPDSPDRLVYTSSTGVYGDHGGDWVDETTSVSRDSDRQRVLVDAERIALETAPSYGIEGTVVRLAGTYGPGRFGLGRYLEGPVVEGHRNFIHRDDAAGAVRFLLDGGHAIGEPVVVVDDEPVHSWTIADWLADQCGVPRPPKIPVEERLKEVTDPSRRRRIAVDKRCSNAKLRRLGYEYAYPTYREGFQRAIEADCGRS